MISHSYGLFQAMHCEMHCVKMHPQSILRNAWGEIHLHNYIGTAYNHKKSFWMFSAELKLNIAYCLAHSTGHLKICWIFQMLCPNCPSTCAFLQPLGLKIIPQIHWAMWNSPGPETLILREYCLWLIIEWNNLRSAVSDQPLSKHTLSIYWLCAFSSGRCDF